jgi:hypothetical protein
MITEVEKLPPFIECDDCKLIFSKGTFLWHLCGEESPTPGSVEVEEDDDEGEEDQEFELTDDNESHLGAGNRLSPPALPQILAVKVAQQVSPVTVPLPEERLPFKFLPPEQVNVVERIRTHIRSTARGSDCSREVDWSRLHRMQKRLNASLVALGEDGWWGYAVFSVPRDNRFLLESVVLGNAAYVIEGDWREAIHYSKAEIRREYLRQHQRIVHTGDWIARLQSAVTRRRM